MKKERLPNGKFIEYYDGAIDDLPVLRHHKFNEYVNVDAGIGSDMNDADKHILACIQQIDKGDKELAKQTLFNLRENLHFVFENMSPKMMAFGVLVHSYNGKLHTDISEYGTKNILEKINSSGVAYRVISNAVEEVKKKLKLRLPFTSPTS